MLAGRDQWRAVASGMKTFRLSPLLRLLVPALLVSSLPKNAIGFSFERGRAGIALGSFLLGSGLAVGGLLFPAGGLVGLVLSLWLLGTTGALMLVTGLKPMAFVKPLCSGCRLLPVIEEHEAIHLAGVEDDDEIWRLMRSRHSCASLALDGDPAICWFCPIPKRLQEH
ncbi:MAG: hypothetical protein LYZ70_06020 [Nitrososphaerales archaeon]|nr:hypothetical protein [Nitrososphaerales archaeon]